MTAGRLSISRLMLTDFRSYEAVSLEIAPGPVILTGPNGAGKTNLLEAVSFLSPGRGLRGAKLTEIARRTPGQGMSGQGTSGRETSELAETNATMDNPGHSNWAVAAEVETPDGPRMLGTGRDVAGGNNGAGRERRLIKIDGEFVRGQQALSEILSVVWLTPQMDGLFRESASGRRRFMDRLTYGFDPEHAGRISAYEHAMRERSRLLKSGRNDATWVASLEDTMARYGVAIAAARRAFLERLAWSGAAAVSAFPRARLALAGDLEAQLESQPALAVEDELRDRLAAGRGRDAETGGASVGPHRSDLVVHHVAKDMPAALCSTGEQKALLISMVLAHARLVTLDRGAPPLLLLDEVAAHLDASRRGALYNEILALGAQAWLTGTEASVFLELADSAQFFKVRDGGVAACDTPRDA
ncbi:DNA replication/repair protein RecF [Denitrobaculum tricleocarpae]|uniref:DNA replication and repair protein RecF n=2 Tax=Denitrobaculum tricleocarpae TaxID=2591009 RepID=A0A545TGL8_9PROT|nr:DNA replication/repair protein RecF [Denitrobaculum tricleocarpae]TQV76384.1 DNA replication/repair protein RecF [Denitrobaculum tricleocarpae]